MHVRGFDAAGQQYTAIELEAPEEPQASGNPIQKPQRIARKLSTEHSRREVQEERFQRAQ